jgi:hypothetical protein
MKISVLACTVNISPVKAAGFPVSFFGHYQGADIVVATSAVIADELYPGGRGELPTGGLEGSWQFSAQGHVTHEANF